MSRKTVPILMASIAVLFLALVIIIIMMLTSNERRDAAKMRSGAIKTLLSVNTVGDTADGLNLAAIASSVTGPILPGGSLDNLAHFMSKDPGRRDFSSSRDRRRAKTYLRGAVGEKADIYAEEIRGTGAENWIPEYVGTVMALFDEVKIAILTISGYPSDLTFLGNDIDDSKAVFRQVENAVASFGSSWIPSGESLATYDIDRQLIRSYLLGSRRFVKRMDGMDNAWMDLQASLYGISEASRWKTAVAYAPSLEKELDELIIIVLAADIHRRGQDMMTLIEDFDKAPGSLASPGIRWMPEFSYYKNIPELTGQTADEDPTIFFAKVNLGYTFRDTRTQTWLNRRKDWLSDYFSSYFSQSVSEDFSPVNEPDMARTGWKSSRLKAEGIHGINEHIAATIPFGVKKVYGVRDMALVRVNLLANP